jgi:hypothetical protein
MAIAKTATIIAIAPTATAVETPPVVTMAIGSPSIQLRQPFKIADVGT